MPRYYESETLIDFIKQNTPHINGETTIACVERAIREAPTADVAPRAEVEKWKNAMMAECMLSRCTIQNELRAEVAREILQEVRQALLNMVIANSMGESYDIEKRFAEIEKKYTEEK